jgi:hypothetical protein
MKKTESRLQDVRVEVVTTTFVASGQPEGIHDLDRFVEVLNNPQISQQITLIDPAVRPLYRASDQLHLGAPLLVRREEIVFANFEGPSFAEDAAASQVEAPVLLLAPPFQIQGVVSLARGSDPTQALRAIVGGFFAVRRASVFDADGNALGEGEQIIVNGAAVQMTAATGQHIELAAAKRTADTVPPISVEAPIAAEAPVRKQRAA